MTDLNTITLGGRVTRDCEFRVTESGMQILNFSIASNKWNSKEKKETAFFTDCVIWGKYAELMNKVLVKGLKVCIVGSFDIESWEDKNTGQTRTKPKVIVQTVSCFTEKKQSTGENAIKTAFEEDFNDDIPF
jgi:single-strand DNA-binding protein